MFFVLHFHTVFGPFFNFQLPLRPPSKYWNATGKRSRYFALSLVSKLGNVTCVFGFSSKKKCISGKNVVR